MPSVTVGWSYTQYNDVDRVLLCRSTTLNSESTFEFNLNSGIDSSFDVIHDEPASNYTGGTDYTFVDDTAVNGETYYYCIAVKGPGASGLYKVGSTAADASTELVTSSTPLGVSSVAVITVNAGENSLPLYCKTTFEPFRGLDTIGTSPDQYIAYSNRLGVSSTAPSLADRPIPGTLIELTWTENRNNPRSQTYLNSGSQFDPDVYPLINTSNVSNRAIWYLTELSSDYAEYELGYIQQSPQNPGTKSRIIQDTGDTNKNNFVGFDGVTYSFDSFHAPVSWSGIGTSGAETNFGNGRKYLTNYVGSDRIAEPDSAESLNLFAGVDYYRSLCVGGWSGDDADGSWVDPKDSRRTHGAWSPFVFGIQSQKSFQVIGTVHQC